MKNGRAIRKLDFQFPAHRFHRGDAVKWNLQPETAAKQHFRRLQQRFAFRCLFAVFDPAFNFLAHLAPFRRLAEFGVQSLQVGFDAPAVAKHEARHEAENWIVNLAGFRDRNLASGWLRLDLKGPSASERKLGIGDLGHKAIRWSFLDTLVGYGLPVLVDLFPGAAAIARRKFFRAANILAPIRRTGDHIPDGLRRLSEVRGARSQVVLRQHGSNNRHRSNNYD